MIFAGGIIALFCLVAPNVYMLGENASWVPVICVIVFLVGLLRCIDAIASETVQGFLFNIQGGILDIIVSILVIFSTNDEPNNLNLLIVSYLLMQGIHRNILLMVEKVQNPMVNRVTGMISIILGLMIWIDWPSSLWFLAFSLSVDICFRGWVLRTRASLPKMEPANDS